ncbi:mycothiol synthase [Pseudonocardia bannensis]|uniref:Mycothiol acetyltransferase n=1 Tax=Pseudonocardia bannensis TaxID=630973 RepID=A0A848DPN2_9PSEU|nr:mycothiol synthase [Pseudonocardia bannensis]NMH94787.1 mycothiol synthase [Pseudonocardia bannensis]
MVELSLRRELDEAQIGAVSALAAATAEADGTAPLSEQFLLNLRRGGSDRVLHVLAPDPDGGLAGYAQVEVLGGDTGAVAELVVHPGHRRAGLGGALVRPLLEQAAAAGARLNVWSHGDHPGAARLAGRLGFSRVRELWQMRRNLTDPLPAAEFPADVRVRPFVVGADEDAFLRVNNAAFDWHPEQGGWGLDQVREREAEPWFDAAGFLLAVDPDDRLLGYHWTKVHPATATEGPIGEVYVLGVDPGAQGRRLGAALTLAGLHHLRAAGLTEVLLYVEADNHAAVRVYQKLGFSRFATDVSYLY